MKALLVLTIGLLFVMTKAQDPTEVQAVLNLLADLKNNVDRDLSALDQAWEQRQQRKQALIDSLSLSTQEQRSECQARDDDVTTKKRDIDITNKFIDWMLQRQTANSKRLTLLEDTLCRKSNNYVNDVKNDKIALALVRFLKKELSRVSEGDLSLVQKTWAQRVKKFIDVYRSGRLYAMMQIKQDEESGEIIVPSEEGQSDEETLLILEGDAEIVIDDLDAPVPIAPVSSAPPPQPTGAIEDARSDLLNLLQEFEEFLRQKLEESQNDEVNSNMTYIDFKIQVEKENETYTRHVQDERDSLTRLNNQLTTKTQSSNLCKARLVQISQALQIAQEDLEMSRANYEEVKNGKKEELTVFEEVYRIYVNQVANASN